VIDVIHGATSADVFTAAAQAGYLVDVGSIRVGPIAGLDYTHARIHAYTETGDSLLTMMVGQQSVDDLIGDVGFELRSPFAWGGALYSPFVNVTAEKDLPRRRSRGDDHTGDDAVAARAHARAEATTGSTARSPPASPRVSAATSAPR
jgi:uncharacterized protein YhjY with autotransporter beta-barrel domain